MAIHVTCPSCGQGFNLADSLLGKKVKCRGCQGLIKVESDQEPEEEAPREAIRPAPRPTPTSTRVRAEEGDEAPRPRRRPRDVEDEEVLARERRPRSSRDERADEDDEPRGGTPWGWILGGCGAGVAVLVGVLILVFSKGDEAPKGPPVVVVDPKIDPFKKDPVVVDPGPGPIIDPPKKNPDPLPKKDRPKKEPVKKDPPKKEVENIPWTAMADPGSEVHSPAKAGAIFPFFGNPELVFPSTPSAFVAVRHGQFGKEGWQVFDLEKGKDVGLINSKLDLDKPALSPDGKWLAGKAKNANFKQALINVHDVTQGGKVVRSVTMDIEASPVRWLDFLADDHLLTYRTKALTAIFEIWNAQGDKVQDFSLKGLLDERERMCLSPGRKYLAVADDAGIHIYQPTTGKQVGFIKPPLGFSNYTGMAFSPDGSELAVYGSMFGSSSNLATFKMDQGTLGVNHKFTKDVGALVKHRFGYKGKPVEWLPEKGGWLLFGQAMIDYVSGAPIHDVPWPAQEFSYFPRRFVGPDHLVATMKDAAGTRMGYLPLPKEKIAQTTAQARASGGPVAELPPPKTGDLAGAVKLENPGGDVAWAVVPDGAGKPAAGLGKQPVSLRGKAEDIHAVYFSRPEAGQASALSAHQPNPLANRRQYRVERYDLVKGSPLNTTDLFAMDQPANPFPGAVGPGGPIKMTPFHATAASPEGTLFAACRVKEPQRLDVWNLAEGKHLTAWKPHAAKVDWCGFLDEKHLLTVGGNHLVLWELPDLKAKYLVEGYQGRPHLTPGRKHLLALQGGVPEFIEAATGKRLGRLQAPPELTISRLQAVAFSPDGKEAAALVFTNKNQQLVRWDLTSGAFKDRMDAPAGSPGTSLEWAGPKHLLIGHTLYNWDLKAAAWQYGLPGPGTHVGGGPDGRHWFAYTAGKEGPQLLAAQNVPDAGANQLAQLISAGQVRQAIPPGTNFQIVLNGYGAMQSEIHGSVTSNLKNGGFNPGAGGVTVAISAQEGSTGKVLDYEIRKVGKIGIPMGGKQMVKIGEKKVSCQVLITDATGAVLEKRDAVFETPGALTFEGDNYQMELDRAMWNSAASFARGVQLPTNVYRVQGQLTTLPRQSMLKGS